jgi:hypothetical protein
MLLELDAFKPSAEAKPLPGLTTTMMTSTKIVQSFESSW